MMDNRQIPGEIKEKFSLWWKQSNVGRPLMHICVDKEMGTEPMKPQDYFATPEDVHTNPEAIVHYYEAYAQRHSFMAEGFMDYKMNFGPGSLALYLGGDGEMKWDNFWFREAEKDHWEGLLEQEFSFENKWLQRHLQLHKDVKKLTGGNVFIPMPDIVDSIDTMSALYGAQNLCMKMIFEPNETIQKRIDKIDDHYLKVFDLFHDVVAPETGGNGYAGFKVWGEGKTAKMQCDFCALMNPTQIATYLIPTLKRQSLHFDHSFYHLDGVDAARHIDLFMGIEEMDAIQWTNGAGKPDGLWDGWYETIYDKVMDGGKSLYILVEDGTVDDWISGVNKLVSRYGSKNLFIRFLNPMSEADAQKLMIATEIGK